MNYKLGLDDAVYTLLFFMISLKIPRKQPKMFLPELKLKDC